MFKARFIRGLTCQFQRQIPFQNAEGLSALLRRLPRAGSNVGLRRRLLELPMSTSVNVPTSVYASLETEMTPSSEARMNV
jgi:hypothetical protein